MPAVNLRSRLVSAPSICKSAGGDASAFQKEGDAIAVLLLHTALEYIDFLKRGLTCNIKYITL